MPVAFILVGPLEETPRRHASDPESARSIIAFLNFNAQLGNY
jgi:hypothetical protein